MNVNLQRGGRAPRLEVTPELTPAAKEVGPLKRLPLRFNRSNLSNIVCVQGRRTGWSPGVPQTDHTNKEETRCDHRETQRRLRLGSLG